ncbi:sensor histidine kinase [Jatrophihabitans fulvus]
MGRRTQQHGPVRTGPLIVLLAVVGLAAATVQITTPGWGPAVVAFSAAVALAVIVAYRLGAAAPPPAAVEPPSAVPRTADTEDVTGHLATTPTGGHTDLIAAVSHDLRNPLATIGAYVELLEAGDAGELSGDQRQMLDVVEENVRRAYAIADDLVELRAADTGRHEPVRIADVVAATVRATAPTARERGLRLGLESDLGDAQVLGNAVQLERVLGNLLSNAVKFTPGGGSITVRAHADDGRITIGVSDTGAGIAPGEQGRIFDRYYRADAARAGRVPGSGLGLAIVRELTAEHGGTVEVRSKPGKGATFTLTLPRLAVAAA